MIVDLREGNFNASWFRFREAICNHLDNNDNIDEAFWKLVYEWAKIKDIPETDNLVIFDSEEDAAAFLLKW